MERWRYAHEPNQPVCIVPHRNQTNITHHGKFNLENQSVLCQYAPAALRNSFVILSTPIMINTNIRRKSFINKGVLLSPCARDPCLSNINFFSFSKIEIACLKHASPWTNRHLAETSICHHSSFYVLVFFFHSKFFLLVHNVIKFFRFPFYCPAPSSSICLISIFYIVVSRPYRLCPWNWKHSLRIIWNKKKINKWKCRKKERKHRLAISSTTMMYMLLLLLLCLFFSSLLYHFVSDRSKAIVTL